MSRAFVKEQDGEQSDADLPERTVSDLPNYVTPNGLEALRTEVHALTAERAQLLQCPDDITAQNRRRRVERDLRYFERRLQSAVLVDPAQQVHDDVRFGARVTLVDEDDVVHVFQIVGEDEADAALGRLSWSSPLGRALLGRRRGESVVWERPSGITEASIVAYSYGAS